MICAFYQYDNEPAYSKSCEQRLSHMLVVVMLLHRSLPVPDLAGNEVLVLLHC